MLTSQQRKECADEHSLKSLFQNWDRLFVLGDQSRHINGQRAEIFSYLFSTPFHYKKREPGKSGISNKEV
jgi:hypothetical protein